MLRIFLTLLLSSCLCHAHRPGTSDNSQPLLIDPRGRQISVQRHGVYPFPFSLLQSIPTDKEHGEGEQNGSQGGVVTNATTEPGTKATEKSSDDLNLQPPSPNADTASLASPPISNTVPRGAFECTGKDASEWDESEDKYCISKAAAEFREDPRHILTYCHNQKWEPSCFESSPLKFQECHDAFREGVWAMRAPAMTMQEAKKKFGASIEMYKFAADAISKEDSEEDENFKDILFELQKGTDKEGLPDDNPAFCYILRAMAPQRLWVDETLKLHPDQEQAIREGVQNAFLDQQNATAQFHSPLHDALLATAKKSFLGPIRVGLRVKKDMEDIFKKIQELIGMNKLDPFCGEDWSSAPAQCKTQAMAVLLLNPILGMAKSGIPAGPATWDEIPTKDNMERLYRERLGTCLLNDPEIQNAFITGVERQEKAQGRVFSAAITSLHDRQDLNGKLNMNALCPGAEVSEDQEKELRDAGLGDELNQLTEEDLGIWNNNIELMEPSIKDQCPDIQPGSKVTQKSLDEVTKALDKTREDLEDERFIRYETVLACSKLSEGESAETGDSFHIHKTFAPNFHTVLRQLHTAEARNDPKVVASALKKALDALKFDRMVSLESILIFFLATPSVWKDDDVWKLFLDVGCIPTLSDVTAHAKLAFGLTGVVVKAHLDTAEFKKILKLAEAKTEIPSDDQHTLRAAFAKTLTQATSLQADVSVPPAKGYLCNALSSLRLCSEKDSGVMEFECSEETLMAKTAEHEYKGYLANQNETEIMESGPFTVKLDSLGYSLGGELEDGQLKDKELTMTGPTDEKPDGEHWKYKECTSE